MKRALIASVVAVIVLAVLFGGLTTSPTAKRDTSRASDAAAVLDERQQRLSSVAVHARQEHAAISSSRTPAVRYHRIVASGARRAKATRDRIAFTSNRTGTAQIWLMNADGSNQKRLTHSAPMEDIQPAWSPDGKKIAFSRSVPAWYESANLVTSAIWVIDADGTNEQLLASAPGTTNFRPQWSPDGSEIVFVRGSPAQAPFDIWVMDADGSNQRALTDDGASTYPAWSPDGTKIAYLSALQVWVMDADGKDRPQRITTVGPNYVPSWAPGSRILFTSERDGGGKQIYVMDPDGSNQTRLSFTDGEDKMPTWSPDGKRIAFARGTRECGSEAGSVVCQVNNRYEIHTMKANGSNVRRLTFTELPERQFGENYPVWRPSGRSGRHTDKRR